jgi:hypothetical protein
MIDIWIFSDEFDVSKELMKQLKRDFHATMIKMYRSMYVSDIFNNEEIVFSSHKPSHLIPEMTKIAAANNFFDVYRKSQLILNRGNLMIMIHFKAQEVMWNGLQTCWISDKTHRKEFYDQREIDFETVP